MKQNKIIFSIVVLIFITLFLVAIGSYALWQLTQKQQNKHVVGTTCLNVKLENESGGIDIENAFPITDVEAIDLVPYTFTITNNCDIPVNYIVGLESISNSLLSEDDYLNYNYLRVQLDDDDTQIYGELTNLSNDNNTSYTVRTTKDIEHHTLGANASVTHELRLWLDEDMPLQNPDNSSNINKYFYGKIKIIAGQGITGDPEIPVNKNLRILSNAREPVARLRNIKIGDRLGYQGEEFYVIGIDGNNVKLLSRYLLNVHSYARSGATKGLQNAEIGYTRTDVNDSTTAIAYYYNKNLGVYYGTVTFSFSNYWWDNSKSIWKSPYSASNNYVYNGQSNLKEYTDKYVKTLQTRGLSATEGTILSLEDVSFICGTNITSTGNYSGLCPNYIFETTYWLGSVYNNYNVWYINAAGNFRTIRYSSNNIGVRPVITILMS